VSESPAGGCGGGPAGSGLAARRGDTQLGIGHWVRVRRVFYSWAPCPCAVRVRMPSPNLIDPARLPAGGPAGLTNQPYRVGEDHTDSDGSVEKVSPGSTAITGRRNQPAPTRRTAMFLKKKKKSSTDCRLLRSRTLTASLPTNDRRSQLTSSRNGAHCACRSPASAEGDADGTAVWTSQRSEHLHGGGEPERRTQGTH